MASNKTERDPVVEFDLRLARIELLLQQVLQELRARKMKAAKRKGTIAQRVATTAATKDAMREVDQQLRDRVRRALQRGR